MNILSQSGMRGISDSCAVSPGGRPHFAAGLNPDLLLRNLAFTDFCVSHVGALDPGRSSRHPRRPPGRPQGADARAPGRGEHYWAPWAARRYSLLLVCHEEAAGMAGTHRRGPGGGLGVEVKPRRVGRAEEERKRGPLVLLIDWALSGLVSR